MSCIRQLTLTLSGEPGDHVDIATDVPSIACVINRQSIFVNNLDGRTFFYNLDCRILFLSVCLLLVYFVSAVGCYCFDYLSVLKFSNRMLTSGLKNERLKTGVVNMSTPP